MTEHHDEEQGIREGSGPVGGSRPTFVETFNIPPVLFGYVSVIVIFLLYQGGGAVAGFLIYGLMPGAEQSDSYRVFTGAAQILLLLVPTLLVVRLATRSAGDFMRLKWPGFPALLVPLAGILSLQQLLQIYMVFQERIPLPDALSEQLRSIEEIIDQAYRFLLTAGSLPELILVITIVALIPALSEELFFRGLVQRCFEKGIGPVRGVIVTGIIFGAFHMNPFSVVPLILLGIYLGFLTYRAGSVWVSVAAHFFNNLLATLAFYFGLGEDGLVSGDPHQMSFGTLMLTFWFSGVIFLLSTYYFLHLTRAPDSAVPGSSPSA